MDLKKYVLSYISKQLEMASYQWKPAIVKARILDPFFIAVGFTNCSGVVVSK